MLSVDDETDHGMTLISSAGVDLEIVTEELAIKMHDIIQEQLQKNSHQFQIHHIIVQHDYD